eukprot:COSAG04_NODE_5919_length_1457_cov_1.115611_3_plen_32_part_01
MVIATRAIKSDNLLSTGDIKYPELSLKAYRSN